MSHPSPLGCRQVVVTDPDSRFLQALVPTLPDEFIRPDSPIVGAGRVKTETTARTGAAISHCERTALTKQRRLTGPAATKRMRLWGS